jgi:hypothetical protein
VSAVLLPKAKSGKPRVMIVPPVTEGGDWWVVQEFMVEIGTGRTMGAAIRELSRRLNSDWLVRHGYQRYV